MKRIVMLAALACLLCVPAAADDCKPLAIITSVPMQADASGRVTIPISFNGVQKQFLLDTAGAFPQISSTVADELKLPQHDSGMRLYAVNGGVISKYAVVSDFGVGLVHRPSMELMVAPLGMDGLFVPTIFHGADFEMDFAAGKFNILSSDHCEGKVIYWKANAVAAVPIVLNPGDHHIVVPVTVDGHNFRATIDTGASTSTMRLNNAEVAFHLDPESPDMKIIGHLNGDEKAFIYDHAFKTLTFEGVTVNNPHIEILTDIVNKNAEHAQRVENRARLDNDDLTLPDVIVGMDVLRKLHLYLAMQERRLYITEAAAPASASPAP